VLREVLALADGKPRPAFSSLFSPELHAIGAEATFAGGADAPASGTRSPGTHAAHPPPPAQEIVARLPVPQVDTADPAAGYIATLSTLDPAQRNAALSAAAAGEQGVPPEVAQSPETRLALARGRIVNGDLAGADAVLADLAASDQADWRTAWYYGLRHLAAGQPGDARTAFDAVCDALPGELAAKLALGLAAEAAGDRAAAGRYFELVLTVDPMAYVSAAFGLARTRLDAGDPGGAIAALAAVPDTSSYHEAAQIAAVRIQVAARPGRSGASPDDLRQASDRLARLNLDSIQQELLTAEILRAALDCVAAGGSSAGAPPPGGQVPGGQVPGGQVPGGQLLGWDFTERGVRFGLERSYRAQARQAADQRRRIELVDEANHVRPGTWS
jgi:serine/threonine-protein kinase PknG